MIKIIQNIIIEKYVPLSP